MILALEAEGFEALALEAEEAKGEGKAGSVLNMGVENARAGNPSQGGFRV